MSKYNNCAIDNHNWVRKSTKDSIYLVCLDCGITEELPEEPGEPCYDYIPSEDE